MFRLPDDIARDALALVQCAHDGDYEGARAVLDNCDVRVVAAFLSRVVADIVEEIAEIGSEPPAVLLGRLRAMHDPGLGGESRPL